MDDIKISAFDKRIGLAGKGTTGTVYVYRTRSKKLYALKKYNCFEKSETFGEYTKKTRNEYDILSLLSHLNVVKPYKFQASRIYGKTYLYLEYCGRMTLKGILKDNNDVSPAELHCFIRQIYNSILYIHSKEVCHRDLKFDNIMLGASGHIKLIDFLDARNAELCYGLVGTTPYIAPEVFSKLEYIGQKADVWSLGIIFYYMLLKRYPWKAAKAEDTAFNAYKQDGKIEGLDQLPEQIQQLLRKCLQVDPESRSTAEGLLDNQWLACIDHCSIQSTCKYDHKRLYVN